MLNRLDFNKENNRVKNDLEKSIKYMLEEKYQLEQTVRAGEDAKNKLDKLEENIKVNMTAYLGIQVGGINEMS